MVKNYLNKNPSEKKLKILMVTAETRPFAQVGGQGSVVYHLSKALRNIGHDARVFMPKFGFINEEKFPLKYAYRGIKVPTGHKRDNKRFLVCNVKFFKGGGAVPAYFLENMEYYEKRANVYGYSDDHIRWALLARGCLEFFKKQYKKKGNDTWIPDVIHAHDWHAGLVTNYLKTNYKDEAVFYDTVSAFTIHNLQYQGMVDFRNVSELDFDDGRSAISPFFNSRLKYLNFLKRGVLYADVVSTVSNTYSKEILTPEYGEGLDKLLDEISSKLSGIVNGVDYDEFNPKTDKFIKSNYDVRSISRRAENKLALQREFDLPQKKDIPMLAFVGRLDHQKGLDLILDVLWVLLRDFDVQFVQVGGGANHYERKFRKLKEGFPDKVGVHTHLNFTLSHLVFSGADMMLLPSKFEPCGLVQVESMRYGCIPIVRSTGGLADTVDDFDPATGEGTGFVFNDYNKYSFFAQVIRALETYRYKDIWRKIIRSAMLRDFSWESRAGSYISLYHKARLFKDKVKEEV